MKNGFFGKKIDNSAEGNDREQGFVATSLNDRNSEIETLVQDIENLKLHLIRNGLNAVSEDRILEAINLLGSKQYEMTEEFLSICEVLRKNNVKKEVVEVSTPQINTKALEHKLETMIEKIDIFSASLASVNSKISSLEYKLDRIANESQKYTLPSINPYKIDEIDQKSNQMLVKLDRALEKISAPKEEDFAEQFELVKDGIRGLAVKIKDAGSRDLLQKFYLEMNAHNDFQREKTETLVDNIKNIEQVLEKLDIIRDEVVSASYNDLSRELSQISKFLNEDDEIGVASKVISIPVGDDNYVPSIIEEKKQQIDELVSGAIDENSEIAVNAELNLDNKMPNLIELCSFSLEEAVKDIINGDDN